MATNNRAWVRYANRGTYVGNIVIASHRSTWDTSPRVNGKLHLRPNSYSKEEWQNHTFSYDGKGARRPPEALIAGANSAGEAARAAAYSEAYGRFRGRLYKGSASLGVTAASYRQSREMIVGRASSITRQAEAILSDFGRRNEVRGRVLKRLANNYLETVFGWQPLLADIKAAATTVVQLADRFDSVGGVGSRQYQKRYEWVSSNGYEKEIIDLSGSVRVHTGALVRISNPNTWLAERAGSLNVMAVAWDLVPWSFVVNMFANTGQLVNSITDFVGLSFQNASTTTTFREGGAATETLDRSWVWPSPGRVVSHWTSGWSAMRKTRTVGPPPRPSLTLKLPDANWELAAIAASLMVQKVTSVGLLIRSLDRTRYTE